MGTDSQELTRSGVVVKLDRGFPLVKLEDGAQVRCEHATALVKGERMRAAIGDRVIVEVPCEHDKGIIRSIEPRRNVFVRRDPAQRTTKQVLAANFDMVIIAEPIVDLNKRRLERELVLAHETGAQVVVALTKADLVTPEERQARLAEVRDLAGASVEVIGLSVHDEASLEALCGLIATDATAILIGKSGVGKSTLVNALVGSQVQDTCEVRAADGKGRHTTVDRVQVELPSGAIIVDMPGIRGLGIWDADQGLTSAFADIEALASQCRFRDCGHEDEPGCAVLAAIERGECAQARLDSYRSIAAEIDEVRAQRDEARRRRGEKASDRKRRR